MVLNLSVPELKELKPKITVFGVGGALKWSKDI